MTRFTPMPLRWYPFRLIGTRFATEIAKAARIERRLAAILSGIEGTPFHQLRCADFAVRVLDELYGLPTEEAVASQIPTDIAAHDRRGAVRAMRMLLERYPCHKRLRGRSVEPGDLLVVGPVGGGPGHVMIVGPKENTAWHSLPRSGVHQTGMFLPEHYKFYRAYRCTDREEWS